MLQHPRKIDCVVRVVTPENIEFEYMLAGPFQRLPAYLIDLFLRAIAFVFLVILGAVLGTPVGAAGVVMLTSLFLSYFVLSWLYGTYMESRFNGRTIGKMLCSLRVISADGRPINASQAALRNFLRLCDFAPPLTLTLLVPDAPAVDLLPTCLVGLVAMTLTSRMQRVGDLAAGTIVVWEGRRAYNANLQPEDARAYSLAELIPPTFQVSRTLARAVALYMERRAFISSQRREELAGNLAKPLLQLFEMRGDTSADLLLCAIYVRIYQSEDQRLTRLANARKKGQLPSQQGANAVMVPSQASPKVTPTNSYSAGAPTSRTVSAGTAVVTTSSLSTTEPVSAEIVTADIIGASVVPATVVNANEPKSGGAS